MIYSVEKKNGIIVEVFARMAEAEIMDIIKESGYAAEDIRLAAKANAIYTINDRQMDAVISSLSKYLSRNLTMFLIVGIDNIKDDIIKIDSRMNIDSYDDADYYCKLLQSFLPDGNDTRLSLFIDSSYEIFVSHSEKLCFDDLGGKANNMKLISDMLHGVEVLASAKFPEYKECARSLIKYALYDIMPILVECIRRG